MKKMAAAKDRPAGLTIVAAVLWFHTPVTLPHALGIAVAIAAVALFQERDTRAPELATPLVPTPLYSGEGTPLSLAANPRRRPPERGTPASARAHKHACCRAV